MMISQPIKIDEKLLSGDELRKKLETSLPHAQKRIVFVSAYITQTAIDWFCKLAPSEIELHIVCRLLPSDILSGSSQISALKTALKSGVNVSCLHSLHAKIYSIDSHEMYVGSANLTNNGLKIYGNGNLEACSQVLASPANLEFVQNIVNSATAIDEEILLRMQACIDLKERETFIDEWPSGILKDNEGVWVRDFFWAQPESPTPNTDVIHDMDILGVSDFKGEDALIRERLLKTRCMKWLFETLKSSPDQEMYFGFLSKTLHDSIKDDPAPYRKNIKLLLQNLLIYCEKYLKSEIEITRPNHSQKIRLKV